MTHTQGNSWRALALAAGVAVTGACSAPAPAPGQASSHPPTTTTSTSAPAARATGVGSGAPSAATSAPVPAATTTTVAWGTPPKALVERASMSIAAHPGRITATSYVFAATTDTGDWYVLGLDRTYVHDDGSPAEGPDGNHSRSLALTNLARTTDGAVAMIPLSVAVSERLPISWDRVS